MSEQQEDIGFDLENWMGGLPAELMKIPITRLAIPGSHNSGTYTITEESELSPDSPYVLNTLSSIGIASRLMPAIPGGVVAAEVSNTLTGLGTQLGKRGICGWSVCQRLTITQQLNSGIRYFDFRVSTKPDTTDLFIVHGLYGGKINGILSDILDFIVRHPHEVVIIDFQHFYEFSYGVHSTLLILLREVFGYRLCPNTCSMQPLTLDWMREHGKQVVLIYRNKAADGHARFWPSASWPYSWPNSSSLEAIIRFLNSELKHRCSNCGHITQCIMTPDSSYILNNLIYSLQSCVVSYNESFIEWIKEKPPGQNGVNVVILDFVESCEFAHTVVKLNKKLLSSW